MPMLIHDLKSFLLLHEIKQIGTTSISFHVFVIVLSLKLSLPSPCLLCRFQLHNNGTIKCISFEYCLPICHRDKRRKLLLAFVMKILGEVKIWYTRVFILRNASNVSIFPTNICVSNFKSIFFAFTLEDMIEPTRWHFCDASRGRTLNAYANARKLKRLLTSQHAW